MGPYYLALLAEGCAKVGQVKEGLSLLAEAQTAVDNSGECWWEAEIQRRKGLMCLTRNAVAESQTCFRQALDIARHQGARSLELRAAMSLARLWGEQGKREEARELLAPVYGWFTEGFDTADLKEAKALLDELA